MSNLDAWSFSRFDCYELCPLQFKLKFIDKLSTTSSPQMARGLEVHQEIANYLKAPDRSPFPSVNHKADIITELTNFDNKVVEQQWGFDRHWKPTGWFSKGPKKTWLRQILDVGVLYEDMTSEAVDWKTGKHRESHEDQMELQALCVMQRIPAVTHVTTRLVYVDADSEEFGEYSAKDREAMIEKWEAKVAPMFNDTEFLPRPNEKCKWCDFSRSKGGPCKYG